MLEKKIFFNGLNELRAFASLSVIFYHIEILKSRDHTSSLFDNSFFTYFIDRLGRNGVNLFFVLSGFLITYLLLKEKEKYETILLRKFYLRRIFRIWPLYYLIVCISFVIIPYLAITSDIFHNTPFNFIDISNPENYSINSLLTYLFFLPNVAREYYGYRVVGGIQSWSVGVEEQFYILWPLLIFLFARKKIAWVFVLLLLIFIFSNVFIQPASFHLLPKNASFTAMLIPRIYVIIKIIPFEFMTIGAIGGYLYAYYDKKIKQFSKSKYIYLVVLSFVFIFLFLSLYHVYFQGLILGFLFLFLILVTINDENTIVFRNKPISYLGKISYGIYMYHPFVMFLVFPFANSYFNDSGTTLYYNLFVYVFVFSLTILLSHFSYKYFESVFIKIKDTKYKSL